MVKTSPLSHLSGGEKQKSFTKSFTMQAEEERQIHVFAINVTGY